MITLSSIPIRYPGLWIDIVDGHMAIFSPSTGKSVVVLNDASSWIFSQIDGNHTVNDIFIQARAFDPQARVKKIVEIVSKLEQARIISIPNIRSLRASPHNLQKELNVWLHVTNQCNLRCKYCYVWKTNEKMTQSIAYQSIDVMFRDAKKHEYTSILLKFSGGECLLELPLILDHTHYANHMSEISGIRIRPVVLTNGVLLTESVCINLKKMKLHAAVSLDGVGSYHDAQRVYANGQGSFAAVRKGIENLIKYSVSFNVTVTISRQNVDNLPEVTSWLLQNNIQFNYNFYREHSIVQADMDNDDQLLIKRLNECYEIIRKNSQQHISMKGLLDRVSFNGPHLNCCGMGENYLVIHHDGKLYNCSMTMEGKSIGSINDPDVILSMRKGNFLRPKGLTVDGKKPCSTCQWRYTCGGGCPLLTKTMKGTYITNSPYCRVYKALIPQVLRTEASCIIRRSRVF